MKFGACVAALAASCMAAPCAGVLVSAGESSLLPGTTLLERPELAGTSLAPNSFTLMNSNTPGAFQAKLLYDVVRVGDGDLTFTYQVVGSEVTTPVHWQVVVSNLLFPVIDTDVRLDTPGVDVPITASVDASGVVTYSSDVPLLPGEQTRVFFIHAAGITDFRQAGMIELVTDFGAEPIPPGEGSPNGRFSASGYTVVPEPLSLGMLALAVGALYWRVRRT